jgi:hypothetical protein
MADCAGPRLQVVESPSQPSVTLYQDGVRLTISLNTWDGYPSDLSRYYTPIQIQIETDRAEEIQVQYADFLAVDEIRNQYRAVAPAEVARVLFGSRTPHGSPARLAPELYAFHGPWWWHPYWSYRYCPPYYSPLYPYPYYGPDYPYVSPWATSYDILTFGLREGRILSGVRVGGFLYLRQPTRVGNLLTLSWTTTTADGKSLPTLSTEFRIVR